MFDRRLPPAPILTAVAFAAAAALQLAPALAQEAPAPPPAPSASEEAPASRFSGLLFGDYYYVADSHRDELEGQNGFWLRRVYFTLDHTLSKAFSLRFRLEANSKGDFASTGVNTPYVKDAWVKWSSGAHALSFGLAPTPNIELVDDFQGYRSLEKTPLDLYRWDSSRDLGLLAQGGLGPGSRIRYAFQVGNGSGTGSETDASKSVRAQLGHRPERGLTIEAYADWQDRPEGHDISTLEAFAGWQEKRWRASLQYGRQRRLESGASGSDLTLEFLSAFVTVRLADRLALVGRVDRNFDPIPDGESIDYLPFSDQAKSTLGVLAGDVTLHAKVHLLPNLELVTYGRAADGSTPASDVVPRLTLFVSW